MEEAHGEDDGVGGDEIGKMTGHVEDGGDGDGDGHGGASAAGDRIKKAFGEGMRGSHLYWHTLFSYLRVFFFSKEGNPHKIHPLYIALQSGNSTRVGKEGILDALGYGHVHGHGHGEEEGANDEVSLDGGDDRLKRMANGSLIFGRALVGYFQKWWVWAFFLPFRKYPSYSRYYR